MRKHNRLIGLIAVLVSTSILIPSVHADTDAEQLSSDNIEHEVVSDINDSVPEDGTDIPENNNKDTEIEDAELPVFNNIDTTQSTEDHIAGLQNELTFGDQTDVPVPAIYTSYTFSETLEDDIAEGGVSFYGSVTIEPVEPSEETHNLSWINYTETSDIGTARAEKDGVPCVFTTMYCRPARTDRPTTSGYICFDAGKNVPADLRNLNFEVEYFDENTQDFAFYYVNGPDSGNFGNINIPKTGTNTWKTYKGSINDAYFNRSLSTGLVDGKCDYRIDPKGKDLYIRKVSVYNCTKEEFNAIGEDSQNLVLPIDTSKQVKEGFSLPDTGTNGSNITWESSSPSISINGSFADVNLSETAVPVTLTATISINNKYMVKTFDLTVAPEPYKAHALEIGTENWSVSDNKQYVSVPISEADTASGTCILLLVASDKTSGKILNIVSASHALGEEESFTLTAYTDYLANAEYSYYVWNSSRSSLKNSPPASVKPTISTKNRQLVFTWDKAADDFQAISEYAIIMDGQEIDRVSEVSDTTGIANSYTISGIKEGDEHKFSIIAYDHEGLASLAEEFTASLEKMASIDLADCENNSGGISFVLNENISGGDSYTEQTQRDGVICRKNVNRKPINNLSLSFLYFSVDKKIISSDERNVTIEITYFDEGTGTVQLQYNAADGTLAKPTTAATLEDSKTWKTAVVQLTDAAFTSPVALTNSDFRITANNTLGGEICISKVSAIPTSKY
jgi:hypothetical protein